MLAIICGTLKHVRLSARLVDRPVAPRQIPEVLERVVERVVYGVDQEQPEAGDWASEGLIILLAVAGVNHAGQVVMAQLDQVGAHPPDLSAVLGEREDMQELMLHGCGLLYRVQLPELGPLGQVDQLFKKSGDLHGWSDVVEVRPVERRVLETVSALLLLLRQLFLRFLPPLHERQRRMRLRRVSGEQVVHAFDLGQRNLSGLLGSAPGFLADVFHDRLVVPDLEDQRHHRSFRRLGRLGRPTVQRGVQLAGTVHNALQRTVVVDPRHLVSLEELLPLVAVSGQVVAEVFVLVVDLLIDFLHGRPTPEAQTSAAALIDEALSDGQWRAESRDSALSLPKTHLPLGSGRLPHVSIMKPPTSGSSTTPPNCSPRTGLGSGASPTKERWHRERW